jgi:hypothetical protein
VLVAVGFVISVVSAAASIGNLSLSPPFFAKKQLAASIASANIYVEGASLSSPKSSIEGATAEGETLSDMLPSPELRRYIAQAARVPVSQLVIDGPVASDLQRTQQEPTGEKRSNEILAEGDPYRITVDDDYSSPVLDITVQAPTPAGAAALADGTTTGINNYLTHLENTSGTPQADRLQVTQAQPATGNAPGHSGIAQVAFLTLLFVFILWCGLVWAGAALLEHLRVARSPEPASEVSAALLRSSGSSPV